MPRRTVLMAIVAGVVLFVWQTFANLAAPWASLTARPFENEAPVREAVLGEAPEAGVYFLPFDETEAAEGPAMLVAVRPDGLLPAGVSIGGQLLADILAMLLVAAILWRSTFRGALVLTLVAGSVGLLGWILGSLPHFLWWGVSAPFVGVELLNLVAGWTLAGRVLAIGLARAPAGGASMAARG